MRQGGLFSNLWEHIAVGKCLMATQAHDIWLILGNERPNIIRKQDPKFLTFSPMRTKFMKKVNQAVLVSEGEGVPSLILPTEIHGCRFEIAISSVQDVLADVVQQVVHRECVST